VSDSKVPSSSHTAFLEEFRAKLAELGAKQLEYEEPTSSDKSKIFKEMQEVMYLLAALPDAKNHYEEQPRRLFDPYFWNLTWDHPSFPYKISITYEEVKFLRTQNTLPLLETRLTDVESEVQTMKKRVTNLEDELAGLKPMKIALELGQVAFDFEKLALEATGGAYADGFIHVATQKKVYDSTFKKLNKAYRKSTMPQENRDKYEAFLKRVAPNWVGTPTDLANTLDSAVEDMKYSRIPFGHPNMSTEKDIVDVLENAASDKAALYGILKFTRYG
jgi:hypothetical protein